MTNPNEWITVSELLMGAAMASPDEFIPLLRDKLTHHNMLPDIHHGVWDAITRLEDAGRDPLPEMVAAAVGDGLHSTEVLGGWAAAAGGYVTASNITDLHELLTAQAIATRSRQVMSKYQTGAIPTLTAALDLIDGIRSMMHGTTAGQGLGDILEEVDRDIDRPILSYSIGLGKLDEWSTGWWGGDLSIWVAGYGGRKTTLKRNATIAALARGKSVMAMLAEGHTTSYGYSLIAHVMLHRAIYRGVLTAGQAIQPNAPLYDLSGPLLQRTRAWRKDHLMVGLFNEARAWLSARRHLFHAYDARHGALKPDVMLAAVHRHRPDIATLDYLQLMEFEGGKLVERMSSSVSWMARVSVAGTSRGDYNGPHFVVLSQQPEEVIKNGTRGTSAGIKGGGDPANQADFIGEVFYDRGKSTELTLRTRKNRNGAPGAERYVIHPATGAILGFWGSDGSFVPTELIPPETWADHSIQNDLI